MTESATLQLSLAPPDVRFAERLLPDQLAIWAGQVDEVLLVVDRRPGRGRDWRAHEAPMAALLARAADEHPNVRVAEVDYGPEAAERAARFLGGRKVPVKDFRGGPFYSYLFALAEARHDLILHIDCDMVFGGGSRSWLAEASATLAARPDALAICPLPGPPTTDGQLRDQEPHHPRQEGVHTFSFGKFTSRVFLLDRRTLLNFGPLALRMVPGILGRAWGRLRGQPNYAMPEQLITDLMADRDLRRIDMLGEAPGMWAIHPIEHSDSFVSALPELLTRVRDGGLPDSQTGRYNIQPDTLAACAA